MTDRLRQLDRTRLEMVLAMLKLALDQGDLDRALEIIAALAPLASSRSGDGQGCVALNGLLVPWGPGVGNDRPAPAY
jgi:hypothetical protein